ncbi:MULTISPECIES: heme exporter protein CcmD [Rhizobium/Agrobacterium group]|jgi:heme exporter protein D|uniref:Heme exporter protein D n=1 Tax=Agrobacterium tumefaciens TaxID=358 RepID=A0A3G2DLD5_AGRTU|nr:MULTISPECIES: heme exporter protein CcmD [Rhizobium/Agrobacterium group]AHK02542.1 cytochrome c-type biogenesis protein CcmD, interacts with CcmCE [Agrobacterium tumefaciens LBA4213 (Ach5)]AKC08350.1 heme exporter protein D [Agrobacterium tumefaciens]EHJ96877.1 Heme exporter protein D [Agrobacterium tumefaciens 5A]MDP9563146.1 heme exporter protein D [Rhizobium nepotum]AYM17191.1 heme exporter protein D [Agrobacterium tumefaciens]
MTHAFYIGMSYAATGLVVLCLIAWVILDGQARKRELKELEASGVRRRAKAASAGETR